MIIHDTDHIPVRSLTHSELSALANTPYLDTIGWFTLVFAMVWIMLVVVVTCSI